MKTIRYLPLAFSFAIVTGCSHQPPGAVEALKDSPPAMHELATLLRGSGSNGRAAMQLSDLEKLKRFHPAAYDAVKNGDIIVLWGTPLKSDGDVEKGVSQDVLAYEKDAPTAGGWVLFSGGTIKKLTAAELAAPKAVSPR